MPVRGGSAGAQGKRGRQREARGKSSHLSPSQRTALERTILQVAKENAAKGKKSVTTRDVAAALPADISMASCSIVYHLNRLQKARKIKWEKLWSPMPPKEIKTLKTTIRMVARKDPSFMAQDVIKALPKGFRQISEDYLRVLVRKMVAAGEITWKKTTIPGRGGRRIKVYDDPDMLLKLNKVLAQKPSLEGADLARALGVSPYPATLTKLEDNLNTANRYAKATRTPLEKILRDFRALKAEGKL